MAGRQRSRGRLRPVIRRYCCRAPARREITLLGSSAPQSNRPPHFAASTRPATGRQGITTKWSRDDPGELAACSRRERLIRRPCCMFPKGISAFRARPADDARRRRRRQAHTVARKRAEMPDAHGAFGLQMPRASSTIPTPAITISEAAPAPAQKPAAQSSV
jgi:hypothetical protein